MAKQSAGILLYKTSETGIEVLLVHPGGPFWAKKDVGVWSIPKGEFAEGEEPFAAAKREFAEELGRAAPAGEFIELGTAKQPSGKIIYAWALAADFDAGAAKSNTFSMEWPPKSGQQQEFPEADKAAWFSLAIAQTKIVKGQLSLLETLASKLGHTLQQPEEIETAQASLF
jgi:predicted NUDIX family NTP pyrophosphohydrolase